MATIFRIDDFFDSFSDMDRSNLFKVDIIPLEATGNTEYIDNENANCGIHIVTCMAKGVQLPTISNGSPIEVCLKNRKFKVAGDATYDDITLTLMVDSDFTIRRYFEIWSSSVNSLMSDRKSDLNITSGHTTDYFRTVRISKLNRKMETIYQVNLKYAFPTSIDSIDLGWENSDSISEFSVTLAYTFPEIKHYGYFEP